MAITSSWSRTKECIIKFVEHDWWISYSGRFSTLCRLCWNAIQLVIWGGKYANKGGYDWRISDSWCTHSLEMHSVECCNDGGGSKLCVASTAGRGRYLEKTSTGNKTRSNFGQERCEHRFASRFAVSRVSFASKFSRESSAWAFLKRRLVFFCRIRLSHFASKFYSSEFNVGSSQKETSKFVVFVVEVLFAREFSVSSSQKKTCIFVVFVCYVSRRSFPRESSPWAPLKRRLQFSSYSPCVSRRSSPCERVQCELFSKEDLYFCSICLLRFSSKFSSREFTMSSSQKETSIFVEVVWYISSLPLTFLNGEIFFLFVPKFFSRMFFVFYCAC